MYTPNKNNTPTHTKDGKLSLSKSISRCTIAFMVEFSWTLTAWLAGVHMQYTNNYFANIGNIYVIAMYDGGIITRECQGKSYIGAHS